MSTLRAIMLGRMGGSGEGRGGGRGGALPWKRPGSATVYFH